MKPYIDQFHNFALNESTRPDLIGQTVKIGDHELKIGLSAEAQAIIDQLGLYNLGLADRGIRVIKATLRWDNIGLKNPLYGAELPFINWRLFEDYPKDLDQSPADQDTWVDFPSSIPGFMEAYGHEGDTAIVDEWLLDIAYNHSAAVLWIDVDNDWRMVETGEFLPPLNKL